MIVGEGLHLFLVGQTAFVGDEKARKPRTTEREESIDCFFMSSSSDSTTVDEVETSLPPMPLAEMMRRLPTIRPQRRDGMANLIREVGHGEFWTTKRDDQIARMLSRNKAHGVRQTDIATVLGVSDSLVTRIKQRQEARPGEAP